MTLIAFATYGTDRAEFITDTASYTQRVSEMGRTTKHLTMNHLDAAVLTQGNSHFGSTVKASALTVSAEVATFDELVDSAAEWIRHLWGLCVADGTPADDESTVFLLGWSDRAEKFTAWGFASEGNFEPFKIPGLWAMPCPWEMRPSKVEHARISKWEPDHPDTPEAMRLWAAKPPRPAPRTRQEWTDLAVEARKQRALASTYARVIVAGDVFHTRLTRGGVTTERVHQFNDSGDELLQMVRWTQHPLALAANCHCGSGKRYGDCCALVLPCSCRSGKPFGECCMTQSEVSA